MAREFQVLGYDIAFNEKQLAFVRIRSLFEKLKVDILIDIELDLETAISKFSELPTHLAEAVVVCLSETTNLGVQTLCSHGVYEIDEEAFRNRLVEEAKNRDLFAPIQAIGVVADDIEEIEGGGGVGLIGGGFGAEGALRGMAIAGAVNLLTGALSSAAAAGQRSAARQTVAADLKKPGNLQRIIDALEQLVDQGLWLTAGMISSRKSDALKFPSEDDMRQARALISNLSKGRVPEAQRKDVMASALEKNPYDPAGHVLLHGAFNRDDSSEEFSDFLEIDYREHASKENVKGAIGDAGGSLRYWFDELLEVFGRFSSKDLHISPHIPARKLVGAKKEYLKDGVSPPEGQAEYKLVEIGEPVALIDTSIFGGGGTGITFTTQGFAWKEQFEEAKGVAWPALRALEGNLVHTIFGVRLFGSEIQLSGISLSKADFNGIIEALAAVLEKRNWSA